METTSNNSIGREILDQLNTLEARILKIEKYLNIIPTITEESPVEEEIIQKKKSEDDEELEFRIGQFWFAKLGIFVFLIGCAIAHTLPFEGISQAIPSAAGYITGIIVFSLSIYLQKRFPHLSGYVLGSGFIILYLATLRLHFFSPDPIISEVILLVVLLLIISASILVTGIKRKSTYLTALGLALANFSVLLSNNPYLIFIVLIAGSILALNIKLKSGWLGFFNYTIGLTFFTHLLWFINNPLIGNTLQVVPDFPANLLFILVYQIIFSFAYLMDKNYEENFTTIVSSLLNTSVGYGLLLLISVLSSSDLSQLYHLFASIIFLVIAITFWVKRQSKMSTFFYAMTGYAALSIGIILQFSKPDFFMWLCWQSLLVVSTAVWFRSKFIIVANFIIYLMIFIASLILSGEASWISLSFGIVALFSARILNWQKDRLELKTEQMRNAYLLTALFIIPYSLYQMMPGNLVAFSWIIVAILYYVFSLLLKNVKYRWMSLATFLLTVLYVFVLGITSAETIYKILSFLILGAALIILSIIYTRNRNKKSSQESVN